MFASINFGLSIFSKAKTRIELDPNRFNMFPLSGIFGMLRLLKSATIYLAALCSISEHWEGPREPQTKVLCYVVFYVVLGTVLRSVLRSATYILCYVVFYVVLYIVLCSVPPQNCDLPTIEYSSAACT